MTNDTKLIAALRILSNEIQSGDGVANACIAEAADRLEELTAGTCVIEKCIGVIAMAGDTASTHMPHTISIPEQSLRIQC